MANPRNLTLADGQLGITAAEIAAGPSSYGGWVNIFFANTGTAQETIILTITRGSAGTARRFKRIVLDENDQCEIIGLPLNSDDSLKALTSTASVVDYWTAVAPEGTAFRFEVQDAEGVRKDISVLNNALFQGGFLLP